MAIQAREATSYEASLTQHSFFVPTPVRNSPERGALGSSTCIALGGTR